MGLRPTRSNVANFRLFRSRGWELQNQVVRDPSSSERNVLIARQFFNAHVGDLQTFGNVTHRVARCSTEDVVSELLAPLDTTGTDWDNAYTSEYLTRLAMTGALVDLSVLLILDGQPRTRGHTDGVIDELMQGRSVNREESDPKYYRGDRNIHHDAPQLQVHVVRLRDTDIETIALALFIPSDPAFNLRYVVRDD